MIGLDNSQENNVEQFIDDVILTCNIVLNRVSLSKYLSKHNKTQIKFRAHKSISKVYDTPEGKVIKIHEHISIHDGVSISVGVKDELDENKVLDILQKIRKIRKGNSQSILNVHNFSKSLREYDLATKSTERLSVFKHLFSSLELAVNCDNARDRTGSKLDNEVVSITGISRDKIKDFREFNSRAKHKDRTPAEEQLYQEGIKQLSGKILELHPCVRKIIKTRFTAIS